MVPYSSGGGFDAVSRALSPYVRIHLPAKVDIVIENKTGAGGVVGTTSVYNSKPDGYNIGVINLSGLVSADLINPVEFDLVKFSYIATVCGYTPFLMVGKDSPYRSVEDLQKAAKPIKLGVTGVGSAMWLWALRASEEFGLNYDIVPGYKGQAEAMLAIMRGDLDGCIGGTALMIDDEHVPLVAFGPQREPTEPDVPTAAELGYPKISNFVCYRGIVAPPGVPDEVLNVLRDAFWKAANEKDFQHWGKGYHESFIHTRNGPDSEKLAKELIADFNKVRPMLEKALAEAK